ncbi:hypothetical protein CGMCC3_g17145 [Colletotrichum fructicola]|nr:uncharacterized protein CGMCC3_g17145 [Colletotrichum fructicola]KAE9566694.1 hypothetical protein CGMCC3_g17145 [Colletotrichum fructicola]
MKQPQFTCSHSLTVKIPPWTHATSTVNCARITVSDGTCTGTITKAPLSIPEYVFDPVTLGDKPNGSPKEFWLHFERFLPKPATASSWSAVAYTALCGTTWTMAPGFGNADPRGRESSL